MDADQAPSPSGQMTSAPDTCSRPGPCPPAPAGPTDGPELGIANGGADGVAGDALVNGTTNAGTDVGDNGTTNGGTANVTAAEFTPAGSTPADPARPDLPPADHAPDDPAGSTPADPARPDLPPADHAPSDVPAGSTPADGGRDDRAVAGAFAESAARPAALGAPVGTASFSPAPTDERPREEIPWLIIWSAIGVVLAAGAAIELVRALQKVIELLVIAGFLAVVLSPAVSGLVRMKIRRSMSTAIVFFLGMAAFGGLGYLFIHPLYREATSFANDLPGTLARVQAGKGKIGSLVARYHLQSDASKYIPKIRTYLSHLGGPALSVARTVLSGLGGLVLLSILTFLLLLEGPSLVKGTLKVLSPTHARRTRRILDDVAKSVTGYVIGNFATSSIAGVVCAVTLTILGVPFAIVFGVWVALVDLLPLIGGLLAGVPTVAFAFLYSPTAGIVTAIVFLVYQQVENHALNPLIMSRTVKLNPLWVLLSVLAGAELAGFIGALFAIPVAGTIHVVARDIWDERRGRLKQTPTTGPDQTPLA